MTLDYDADITLFGKSSGTASLDLTKTDIKVVIDIGTNDKNEAVASIASIDADLSHMNINVTSTNWLMKVINALGHTWPFDDITNWLIEEIIKLLRGTING